MADDFGYGGLPERERNLDPKSRSLAVMFNFLGLLPYARAGAEAMARGWELRRDISPRNSQIPAT